MRFARARRPKAIRVLLSIGMIALFCAMAVSYNAREKSIDELRSQLDTLNAQYYSESMRGNALTRELNQADTDAFVERIARREYGYTNQGEIHYQVSNLPMAQYGDSTTEAGTAQ